MGTARIKLTNIEFGKLLIALMLFIALLFLTIKIISHLKNGDESKSVITTLIPEDKIIFNVWLLLPTEDGAIRIDLDRQQQATWIKAINAEKQAVTKMAPLLAGTVFISMHESTVKYYLNTSKYSNKIDVDNPCFQGFTIADSEGHMFKFSSH